MQDRLKRRVSNHSDCKEIKDLPKVSLERETVPVRMSAFRPQILSKNFHKCSDTPLGLPQSSGSSNAGVFRRHTYHGSNPRAMSGAYAADMAVVDRFRFSGMLLKSNPVVKILASFLGFCQSTLPAIAVAPLHFRNLQSDMIKALKGSRGGGGGGERQGYLSVVSLSPEAKKELEWWRDYLK